MAEVMNLPVDQTDGHKEPGSNDANDQPGAGSDQLLDSSPPPPPSSLNRRRDKDSRERRDERDFDRPQNRRGGGDYYDRNRSPPAPRDRDRDYKRRLSQSPPPYRDRRPYSPSRRSPPFQSFKRSRREDGGYDGRRGGRFGHDYAGGYDRPAYGEDRPHGRFFGRSSGGYPGGHDWDSGRGGYNGMSNSGIHREGLMSYKQFIQELEDDILPSEAERRYEEYKSEYVTTQKRTYFEAHKDEEWLKNKYHPTNLVAVIERRNEHARKVAKDFLLDLHSGELDLGPSATASSVNKSEQANEPNSEDEAGGGGKRRRYGRLSVKESDFLAAPKAHPVSSDPKRIQADVELALTLVRKLDSEKGIDESVLSRPDNDNMVRDKSHGGSAGPVVIIRGLTSVKGLEGDELLDTLVTYLWRVHGVDYYGMTEVSEPKGLRHVRNEVKNSDTSSISGEWQKKLDTHWQERMKNQDPLEVMTGKEKLDAAAAEGLDPFVRKIRDEKYGWKYGCGAKGCTKLFHASEFVHKHLKLKHPELVVDLTSKVREDLYFQNYMNDANAPGGQPVMQQSLLKDRFPRRRPLEGRLKDDRGIRSDRDRDARGTINERIDRSDNPQGMDSQGNNDDPDKGNTDEHMFDGFGGSGIGVPPFGPDIPPPPVLMPVPGAGPLGPFIPAPPEVAMRMMREQGGGPPHFETGGRNGRLGAGGPAIIVPPNFRQDPRRLRSYNDLDAPEDEVTVIDYRSL